MAAKKATDKFYATYRYVAMMRVPLTATTFADAMNEANCIRASDVLGSHQDIHDHESKLYSVEKDGIWL